MAVLSQYDYIFAIGTFFALLDVFNNGAVRLLLPDPTFQVLTTAVERCCQLLGHQCLLEVDLLPMGYGPCRGL
jgi:hypothetical protein